MIYLGVALAGALGAPARYLLDTYLTERLGGVFPFGTAIVNLLGSFVLGLLVGLTMQHLIPPAWLLVLGVGFCGAFTTFSTFAFETVRLVEDRAAGAALANVALGVLAGLLAAGAGLAAAAAF